MEILIDCMECTDVYIRGSPLHFMLFSSVTLEVSDVKTYLAEVGAGSLRARGYRRLLKENTESGL